MESHAVYPGSFDPLTLGHLNIIERICPLFSKVTVLIAHSDQKNYLFNLNERLDLVREALKGFSKVEVAAFEGLTVDYVRQKSAQVIVRGLRIVSDFEYEMSMAHTNKVLNPQVETIIVFAAPAVSFISSKTVKEIARLKGDISAMVPACVAKALGKKLGV